MFWTKVKFSTVDPARDTDWNADGIFSKCGLIVAVTPPSAAIAAAPAAATPLPLPAPPQGVQQTALSVLEAPFLSDVVNTADLAQVRVDDALCGSHLFTQRLPPLMHGLHLVFRWQVQQSLTFYHSTGSTDKVVKNAASCRPDKYGYSLGTPQVAALSGLHPHHHHHSPSAAAGSTGDTSARDLIQWYLK